MDIEKALSNERTSQASIGLTKAVFEQMAPEFEEALRKCAKKNPYRGGRRDRLKTSRAKLLFILWAPRKIRFFILKTMNKSNFHIESAHKGTS